MKIDWAEFVSNNRVALRILAKAKDPINEIEILEYVLMCKETMASAFTKAMEELENKYKISNPYLKEKIMLHALQSLGDDHGFLVSHKNDRFE